MELDSLYQEVILDHYKRPLNKSLAANPDAQVHHVNTSCGDEVTLNLHLEGDRVSKVTWEGVGCSISQASTSVMTDLLIDKSAADALALVEEFQAMLQSKGKDSGNEDHLQDGVAFAGVSKFPARVKCALLGWMAFKDALQQALKNK
ncbi:MAG: Fe-S cluster assembly sulfur transfer protein SufU [Candidatus Nanopelagicaceae bacterium]|jgi:nitrogen fixation NifU-like protein|nr:SUF system NifU family Fe-S cluster assembly protein [Actinomycetota bacterium]NCV43651.1 SUF system NifU family Fe-S cluster assembly protein [Actinomycetota bacterium]NCV83207.1 SUF system NifU family Fe-S cluster assembly protein [Actinomycetota bacterium]NCV95465.1 SUF system NifU family Fe-S cluster assembly protein [Actinomycetota bacterium]NCW47022.1 SUF system NifU family Fe-S cluster assembly protein [Actinomycetota bacterium]